ncbi:MAG: hypothetical protein KGL96_04180, partial [Hyphomicrobiales bacterium]|nr:hypothetical protein [Hyphomicrobiales bacterium]
MNLDEGRIVKRRSERRGLHFVIAAASIVFAGLAIVGALAVGYALAGFAIISAVALLTLPATEEAGVKSPVTFPQHAGEPLDAL